MLIAFLVTIAGLCIASMWLRSAVRLELDFEIEVDHGQIYYRDTRWHDAASTSRSGITAEVTRSRWAAFDSYMGRTTLPIWMVAALPLLTLVIDTALWRWREYRRSPHDCPNCGYDNSGAPTRDCSECGSPIE